MINTHWSILLLANSVPIGIHGLSCATILLKLSTGITDEKSPRLRWSLTWVSVMTSRYQLLLQYALLGCIIQRLVRPALGGSFIRAFFGDLEASGLPGLGMALVDSASITLPDRVPTRNWLYKMKIPGQNQVINLRSQKYNSFVDSGFTHSDCS